MVTGFASKASPCVRHTEPSARARIKGPVRPWNSSIYIISEQGQIQRFEQELLLNSEAESLELSVPMAVQTKAISQENAFKDPLGKFSQNKFLQSLNNAGLSEAKYLEMIKSEANLKQISMPYSFNETYEDKVIKKIMDCAYDRLHAIRVYHAHDKVGSWGFVESWPWF